MLQMGDASNRRRWWTQDEDQILRKEVNNQETGTQQGARNWSAIAEKLPGRSNKDCRRRWTKISLSSRKGPWSRAEDLLLQNAVAKLGFQWTRVAEMVGSRHPDQCAKRWYHSLDPNVNRAPWTGEEDDALIDAVQKIGRDWKEIGREVFPSRSTTDIKNRYVILKRRRGLAVSPSHDNSSGADGSVGVGHELAQLINTNSDEQNRRNTTLSPRADDTSSPFVVTPDEADIVATIPPHNVEMPMTTDLRVPLEDDLHTLFIAGFDDNMDHQLDGPDPAVWGESDWVTFDDAQQQTSTSFSDLFVPAASSPDWDAMSCVLGDQQQFPATSSSSYADTSNMSERSGITSTSTPSTLVLEDLQPETVNLVVDTLLRTNSKFGMRLYNTGS